MAAIDLTMDDDATLPFNITFDELELIEILRKYVFEGWASYRTSRLYNSQHVGSWRDMFTIKIATVLTRFGFCATFNIVEADELFNLDL